MNRGTLILKDGTEFDGFVFGASTNTSGEAGKIISMNFFV
jgi:carbamoylphosphate synthase small subunit